MPGRLKVCNTYRNLDLTLVNLIQIPNFFVEPSHEEYASIQSAYEAMLDVSEYINEVKRDFEQLQIIAEIQASITGT